MYEEMSESPAYKDNAEEHKRLQKEVLSYVDRAVKGKASGEMPPSATATSLSGGSNLLDDIRGWLASSAAGPTPGFLPPQTTSQFVRPSMVSIPVVVAPPHRHQPLHALVKADRLPQDPCYRQSPPSTRCPIGGTPACPKASSSGSPHSAEPATTTPRRLLNARRRHRLDHSAARSSTRRIACCSTPEGVIVWFTRPLARRSAARRRRLLNARRRHRLDHESEWTMPQKNFDCSTPVGGRDEGLDSGSSGGSAPGLKKADMLIPLGVALQGLQTGRSACPPACCITPSASAATSTPAPTIRAARRSSPSARSPRPAAARPAARREVSPRGQVERRFRSLPIGGRATFVVLPIPRVECRACGVVRQVEVPFADPRRSYTNGLRAVRPGAVPAHDHPRRGRAPGRRLGPDQGHPEARPVAALSPSPSSSTCGTSPSTRSPSPRGTAT